MSEVPVVKYVLLTLMSLVLVVALSVGGCAGCKSFRRAQARADANNAVKVTSIRIRQAAQQVEVQRQLARVKVAEAVGIRHAQDEIAKTLTPLYVQHEAIQAQLAASHSPNHTQVYIPSGEQGVPLVSTTPQP
jgi:hypothetical protein